jgi:hypothetical protein
MADRSRRGWCTRMMALVCLCSYVFACHSWRTEPVSPQQVLAGNPEEVRLIRTDSSKLVLKAPSLANDTLRGLGRGDSTVLIPLQQVDSIQVKQSDGGKTAVTVVAITAAAGAVFMAAALASCGEC